MKKYKVSNRDLITFFAVTFGLTIIMGILMGFAFNKTSLDSFPLVQMYYPAVGAMIALLLNKKTRQEVPKNFFVMFLFLAFSSVIYLLVSVFILDNDPNMNLQFWMIIASFLLIFAYIRDRKKSKSIEDFGLKLRKNTKCSFLHILLFIGLYLVSIFISSLLSGELNAFIEPFKNIGKWAMLLLLPISFIFSFPAFLGEEYGWRYFLQPALQERLGKIKGVIVLGLIWGIWHLPINLFYYSPETSLQSIANQLTVCIAYAVFFGFVYMKTKNIWAVSMIHFFNNNLGYVLYEATGTNLIITWGAVLLNIIIFSLVYMPFLLSKKYRKSEIIDMEVEVKDDGEKI